MSQKEIRSDLKRIFRGYSRMNSGIEAVLREYNIQVIRVTNHVVLQIPVSTGGYRRVSLSSTRSDKREGLNIVSKIMGVMNA